MDIRTTPWAAGTPCWVDLATPDVPAARDFYGAVLGWTLEDPDDALGGFVLATVDGHPVAAIGPLQGDMQLSAWTLYLASDDADKTAAAVIDRGGTVLLPPGDVGHSGRMMIASDPTGGVFGVWQAGTHVGASLVNEPGGLSWEDLRSTDPDTARAFYGELFGFEFHELPDAGGDYTTFHHPGEAAPLGGMGGMFGAPEGTPSHWLVYFAVESVAAAVASSEAHDGRVLVPPFDSPYGRMSAVVDPASATFMLFHGTDDQLTDNRSE